MSEEKKRKLLKILLAVFIMGIIVCGVGLALKLLDYKRAADEYEELNTLVTIEEKGPIKESISESAASGEDEVDTTVVEAEQSMIDISMNMDYKALKEKNSDFVGWIYYEPLEISYPVVMDKGDSYYENYSFENVKTSSGAIFMDYLCKRDFTGFNSVIYGHNMRNGTMFGSLDKLLKDEEIIKQNPYFYVFREDETLMYKIVSVYYAAKSSKTYDLKLTWSFEEMKEYVKYMDEVSTYRDEEFFRNDISEDTVICTLSTCHGVNSNNRTVVHGILVAKESVSK